MQASQTIDCYRQDTPRGTAFDADMERGFFRPRKSEKAGVDLPLSDESLDASETRAGLFWKRASQAAFSSGKNTLKTYCYGTLTLVPL
jgi:hypothetical protein